MTDAGISFDTEAVRTRKDGHGRRTLGVRPWQDTEDDGT